MLKWIFKRDLEALVWFKKHRLQNHMPLDFYLRSSVYKLCILELCSCPPGESEDSLSIYFIGLFEYCI